MSTIETRIKSNHSEATHANLVFEISNTGTKDVYVLKRDTPLEGLKSNCLEVTLNGEKVHYDGYFLKRSIPKPGDYVLIRAGQTLSVPIDLSVAYDVSQQGNYEVKFDQTKLVILPAVVEKEDFAEMRNTAASFTIENSGDQFQVERAKPESSTIGAAMRKKSKKKVTEQGTAEDLTVLQPEVIGGGTAEQVGIIENAHARGYEFATVAAGNLGDNAQYELWFGTFESSRAEIVINNYSRIKARMESTVFTYDLAGSQCDDSTFAYTTIGSSTIWLCQQFWLAPPTGFNSQAGTMVHEHSHTTDSTDDLVYGEEKCKSLALSSPEQSINNADSYEFFAESF